MRRWLVSGGVVGVLSLSALFTSGCSSTSDPYPDSDTFCLAKAQSECNSPQASAGESVDAVCNTEAACVNARQMICVTDANKATSGGLRVYSPSGATTCIGAVQSAYANATTAVPYSTLQTVEAACEQGVFPGSVQLMGSCTTSDDCSTDSSGNPMICSPINAGSSLLACATAVPVAAGGFCSNPGSQCAAGTYCLGSKTMAYSCQSGGSAGSACSAAGEGCGVGFFCSMATGADTGSCMAVTGEGGAPCTSDVSCGGGGPAGSTPTTSDPYCDTNIPTNGAPGSCELGLQFGPGADDCKGFGGSTAK